MILVSDPFHMFRLRLEARRTNLEAYTSPTESSPISENPVLELRYLAAGRLEDPGSLDPGRRVSPHLSLSTAMTLVSSERLYTGRVVNLDRRYRAFPRRVDGAAGDVPAPGASAVVPFLDEPRAPILGFC